MKHVTETHVNSDGGGLKIMLTVSPILPVLLGILQSLHCLVQHVHCVEVPGLVGGL